MAISNCRSDKFIESLDEGSTEAMNCKVWYSASRDFVLRRADWPFARKRVALVQSGTPPPEWGYSYALPTDCIAVRQVADGARVRTLDQRIKYAIENDGTGSNRVLLMDETGATLIYTMRAKDVVIYPPEFVEALAWRLAANICRPLDKTADLCAQILQYSDRLIERAAAMSYNENKPDREPKSDLFTSRLDS